MKKKLIYGVGINDAGYCVQINDSFYENGKRKQKLAWICPFYLKWIRMLERCYSKRFHEKHPTYQNCFVCQEWLTFSEFKKWMESQDWEGKELDKDILFSGNKIYNRETCVFVDPKVNTFLLERQNDRGRYLIGVSWSKKASKFVANCAVNGKQKYLGVFDTELEAHKAWLDFKLKLAYQLAAEQTDPRVAKALIERYQNYRGE